MPCRNKVAPPPSFPPFFPHLRSSKPYHLDGLESRRPTSSNLDLIHFAEFFTVFNRIHPGSIIAFHDDKTPGEIPISFPLSSGQIIFRPERDGEREREDTFGLVLERQQRWIVLGISERRDGNGRLNVVITLN